MSSPSPSASLDPRALQERVAELERALARATEAEQRLQTYMRRGGVPVTWLDRHGTIMMINEVGARNLGGRPEDIQGRTIYEIVPWMADQTRERIALAFAGELKEYESCLELGGTRRWYSSFYHPIHDARGDVIAAQIITQELTKLRTAEHALLRSEAMLEAAQRRAQLGTWELDVETGGMNWSKQMYVLMGFDPADPPPSRDEYLDHLHPDDRERFVQAQVRVLSGAAEETIDVRTNPQSTAPRHLSCTLERLAAAPDARIAGTMMDVTAHRRVAEERKQLQAQMEHAQKLESLGVLAGGIAHDFNNLLVSMMGNAELALLDLADDERAREHLHEILAASQRAAELCGQMLAYSGRGQFVVRLVDLSRVVREMAHLLEVSVSKRATVVSSFGEDLPAIKADVTQLGQIVMNLITNASEALEDSGGKITIRTGVRRCSAAYLASCYVHDELPEGDYVFLEVVDEGCGMDSEQRKRMFDPFFSSKATGRGLGLAAVLGIIRGHAGAIEVESAPACGTRITVLFPASSDAPEEMPDSGEWEAPTAGAGTIMVVDDEPPVRTLAERALERSGYLVFTASDGLEAVEFFREYHGKIDLVLLDVTMPTMDGRATLHRLREIDPQVRVILMSGYDQQSAVPGLVRGGHNDFLQKPFRPTMLIDRVKKMLERPVPR